MQLSCASRQAEFRIFLYNQSKMHSHLQELQIVPLQHQRGYGNCFKHFKFMHIWIAMISLDKGLANNGVKNHEGGFPSRVNFLIHLIE